MKLSSVLVLLVALVCFALPAVSQTETATISGRVTDPQGAVISGADIQIQNVLTGRETATKTNPNGIYVVTALQPGTYRVIVSNPGFKQIVKPDVVLNVQDNASVNFSMTIGSASETVTVEGGAPLVNTESATVSTVIDRNFADNLPMNGRSFQTLIYLTPGVVATNSTQFDSGQFSVNGQRPSSNYWMVDGVSANIGTSASQIPGNGLGGSLGSFSALGGTNSLVSIDAMQEFRIQTSTYAPEFGRTPGAQISIATRSGTNQFHGAAFNYFRNDVLDANNWFNGFTSGLPLPKAKERQNDFGGVFSGPLLKDRTFFFFSYEGLRLRLPQTALSNVPDAAARQAAVSAMKPYLNAYPLPNGTDNLATGIAQFNASYSNPGTLDAYSIRVDHKLTNALTIFGRYNYSPSSFNNRGTNTGFGALSIVQANKITTQTATAGATWNISAQMTDDLRFNYSHTASESSFSGDGFGGAIPIGALPFPSPRDNSNSLFSLTIIRLGVGQSLNVGRNAATTQRQLNFVDNLSAQRGSHSMKFGADFRRLTPIFEPFGYAQSVLFLTVPASETGTNLRGQITSRNSSTFRFHNLGVYAQDTWRALPRLTLTYGVRWDLDFAPAAIDGPGIVSATGYSLTDLSQLGFAPAGTPPFKTTYGNIAPRIGITYQISGSDRWQTVVRGGFGVFYDLVSSETGNVLNFVTPPFGNFTNIIGSPFPFAAAQTAPVPIPSTGTLTNFDVFNPNLKLPYTLQWNVALEQALGKQQSLSLSYIGAAGRRLLQSTSVIAPPSNPSVRLGTFVDNTATSDYHALQVQFQRRMAHGVQAVASYTWSHSIDTASAGSYGNSSNAGFPGASDSNRGSSDFDIRHSFSTGITYNISSGGISGILKPIVQGWSLQSSLIARTAPPVDISDSHFFQGFDSGINANIRPDIVPAQPLYLFGTQCAAAFQAQGTLALGQACPGGMGFNPNAFISPPVDPLTGRPTRQGTLGRNVLRGFGAVQWDFAVHREFVIREPLKLQFRAEMFNVLNHPNFGAPNNQFGGARFGLSRTTLAQGLSGGNLGGGGLSQLYQIGGPRSVQLALKFLF